MSQGKKIRLNIFSNFVRGIISLRDFSKLNWRGFRTSSFSTRIKILASCFWTLPLLLLLCIVLLFCSCIWLIALLLTPVIDFLSEDPVIKKRKEYAKQWGLRGIEEINIVRFDDTEYEIFIVSSILMGLTGKLGEYAKLHHVYHIGLAFVGKNTKQELVFELAVQDDFLNCVMPVWDFGITLYPPKFEHHLTFMNSSAVSFYEKIDRNYWTGQDLVGQCDITALKKYIEYTKTFTSSHTYMPIGVNVINPETSNEKLITEPDTCINFVDESLVFLKESINVLTLNNIKCSDCYFTIEDESHFKPLNYQTPKVSKFFDVFRKDFQAALVNSESSKLIKSTAINIAQKLTKRLPLFYWYQDIRGSQFFYELTGPTLSFRRRRWKLLNKEKIN